MTMFANLRRDWVLLPVVLAALVAAAAAGGQPLEVRRAFEQAMGIGG